jgi:hypothetical protein
MSRKTNSMSFKYLLDDEDRAELEKMIKDVEDWLSDDLNPMTLDEAEMRMFQNMDLLSYFRSLSKLEMVILALFAVYIAVDIEMPESIASYIDSTLGMVCVLLVALFLFVYYNPILGVVGLFVAYEIVRRSARMNNRVPMMTYVPTQAKKDAEIAEMNPSVPATLEEEMVAQMAPIGKSSLITYVSSEYKPIAENVHNASMMM